MFSLKHTQKVATLLALCILLLARQTYQRPTRTSTTDTGSRETSSGSGSGRIDDPCNSVLTDREREALIDDIEGGLHGLINDLQGVRLWSVVRIVIMALIQSYYHSCGII